MSKSYVLVLWAGPEVGWICKDSLPLADMHQVHIVCDNPGNESWATRNMLCWAISSRINSTTYTKVLDRSDCLSSIRILLPFLWYTWPKISWVRSYTSFSVCGLLDFFESSGLLSLRNRLTSSSTIPGTLIRPPSQTWWLTWMRTTWSGHAVASRLSSRLS